MSYAANEAFYLKLIQQLLSAELNGEAFCHEFMRQWRIDRDEEYKKRDAWPERYDLQLIAAHQRGELTDEEYHRQWVELWGYTEYQTLCEMLDRIFTACDCFHTVPEGQFEIDEGQLKKAVADNLNRYEGKDAKPSP